MCFKSRSDLANAIVLVAMIVACACNENTSKLDRAPASQHPATTAAPPSSTQPVAAADAQVFCEKTMQKILACFDDTAFWDNFATTWFAKYPDDTGNPDAKQAWIGMRKDDIAGLRRENALAQNCTVMVERSRLPSAADMKPVEVAMARTCGDFGTAMGFMLFHTGVFHLPR